MTAALVITSAIVLWSLWIRRHTWRCRWDRATTIGLALLAATAVFVFPLTGHPVDKTLYALTRLYNLGQFAAGITFLGALCAMVYSAVAKLTPDREFATWFKKWIEAPLGCGAIVLFILFAASRGSQKPHPDFATMQIPGNNLAAYWLVWCGLVLYLMYHAVHAFIDLRRDKPSRPFINIYLIASACIVAGTILRLAIAIFRPAAASPCYYMAFSSYTIGTGILAFAMGWAWISRTRLFFRPGWGWVPPGEKEEWPV